MTCYRAFYNRIISQNKRKKLMKPDCRLRKLLCYYGAGINRNNICYSLGRAVKAVNDDQCKMAEILKNKAI